MAWPVPIPLGAAVARARLLYERWVLDNVPPWLRRTVGGAVLSGMGEVADALVERAAYGVQLRFPNTDEDALAIIGRERRIVRGPTESATAYAGRVQTWLESHQRRGSVYALLEQWHAYNADAPRDIDIVYASGTRYRLDGATGEITRDSIPFSAEDPDGWAQFWAFVKTASFDLPADDLAIDLNPESPDTVIESGAVSTLADDSGNGLAATQATASKRPAFITEDLEFNGRASLSYDGTDDGLVTPSFQPGGGGPYWTVYGVLKIGATALNTHIFSQNTNIGSGSFSIYQATTGSAELRFEFSNPGASLDLKLVTVSGGQIIRFCVVFDSNGGPGASIPTLYINGVDSAVGYSLSASNAVVDFDNTALGVGANTNATGRFWDGKIARLAAYNAAHDVETIQAIDAQLRDYYTPPEPGLALPAADLAIDLNPASEHTVVTSGAVEELGDDSGNALHATQATAAKRPAFVSRDSDFNGRASLSYDGTDDGLVTPPFQPGGGGPYWTVYGVVKTGSAAPTGFVFGANLGGGAGRFALAQRSSGTQIRAYYSSPGGFNTERDFTVSPGVVYRVAVVLDTTDGAAALPRMYLDGVEDLSAYSATNASNDTELDSTVYGVGANNTASGSYFDGKIARLIGYNAAHDVDTIASIDAQLAALYTSGTTGLTILEQSEYTVIPRTWNAAHVLNTRVAPMHNGALLWGYPPTEWGADGLEWPATDPVIIDA